MIYAIQKDLKTMRNQQLNQVVRRVRKHNELQIL